MLYSVQQLKDKSETEYQNLSEKCQELSSICQNLQTKYLQLDSKHQELDSKHQKLDSKHQKLDSKHQELDSKHQKLDSKHRKLDSKHRKLDSKYQELDSKYQELNAKYQELNAKCHELENERNQLAVQCQKQTDKSAHLENNIIPQLLERLDTLEMSMSALERLWVISRKDVNLSSKILGTGGWGVVQEATYKGQRVAAKTIHEEIISDHNQGLFLKEIKMMAKCHHKNLVEFIGAVPDEPAIIVIELMHSTLRSALRKGTISSHQLQPTCVDIAQGLRYLHNMRPKPIIHRDVSAANVLLKATEEGGWTVKLSDFGSAQFAHLAQTPGPGAALYAAPEVTGPPRQQTVKIDVYSYGVLLVEVLTKNIPTGNISVQLQSLQPQWPKYVAISRRCVHRDPSQRPMMTEVLADLDKITG